MEDLKGIDTVYTKEKWERDANIVISVDKWEEMNEQQWRTTYSLSCRKHGWKNIIRFFRIPAQSKYHDTRCWRLYGAMKADHFHMSWSCLSIHTCCQELKKCMDKVLKVNLPLTFEVLYFGIMGIQDLGTNMFAE